MANRKDGKDPRLDLRMKILGSEIETPEWNSVRDGGHGDNQADASQEPSTSP
jgi:hypothetical protein